MSWELSLFRHVPRLAILRQTSRTDSEIIIQSLIQSAGHGLFTSSPSFAALCCHSSSFSSLKLPFEEKLPTSGARSLPSTVRTKHAPMRTDKVQTQAFRPLLKKVTSQSPEIALYHRSLPKLASPGLSSPSMAGRQTKAFFC